MSNETRKLPTRPGWWYGYWTDQADHGDGSSATMFEVIDLFGEMCFKEDGHEYGVGHVTWLAPIPGPAVLAALAEYGEALVGADTSQPKSRERVLARGRLVEAGIAMANAIRAERDGAS